MIYTLRIYRYELRFHSKHLKMVRNQYLPHVLDAAKTIKEHNRFVQKESSIHPSRLETRWLMFFTIRQQGVEVPHCQEGKMVL